jgi:tetratricopeptide (TPR) repeat protein
MDMGHDGTLSLRIQHARTIAMQALDMAAKGLLAEAERWLQQALSILPGDPSIAFNLARVLMSMHRPSKALHLVDQTLAGESVRSANLLLLRAQILLATARNREAVIAFKEAIEADPHNGVAELGLATALGESSQPVATADAARRAIQKGADRPGARYILGRSLSECGRFHEAESELRRALQLDPDHAPSQTMLAELIWMQTSDVTLATRELDGSLQRHPHATGLRVTKAKIFENAGNVAAAVAELEAGLGRDPNSVPLRLAAAQALVVEQPIRALFHAEQAFRLASRDLAVVAMYGDALFAVGRASDAEKVATHGLQIHPNNNHSIALMGNVWRLNGDPRYQELFDYNALIRASPLEVPAGWSTLVEYLADLALGLHEIHQLNAHPVNQTLRRGTQVGIELEALKNPAIRAFPQAIDGAIHRYMAAIGHGVDVFRRRNTMRYKLNGMWTVRLWPQGHHVNHFHGQGWLSSVCYIELPETLGEQNGEGWLKLGEPLIGPLDRKFDPEFFLKPEPGLLALFPSWMWHGTVPFSGSEKDRRLTIAFDVVPA